ncbi:MAG: hypothetical protein ACI8TX_002843, partial [Hyphomicrobiaceae bacterium]
SALNSGLKRLRFLPMNTSQRIVALSRVSTNSGDGPFDLTAGAARVRTCVCHRDPPCDAQCTIEGPPFKTGLKERLQTVGYKLGPDGVGGGLGGLTV